MALFVCDKCEYSTIYKRSIIQHFNKKNPCSNEIIILNKDKYIKMKKDLENKNE